jgi:4-amino-4-deoxy-L-arabinose transferase-like glycosyltransferase
MKVEEIHTEVEKLKHASTFLKYHKIDIAFAGFLVALALQYNFYISMIHVPIGDDAVYLTNARNWLTGEPLFEAFRPPLLSWLIAGTWTLTGENWEIVKYLQPSFTIGAGILLYLILKRYKGALFALGVTSLTMLNAELFYYNTRILTEGLSLFFVIATLYFLKTERRNDWFLAGIMIGLTFASRYPIILPALVIFIMESFIRKDLKLVSRTLMGAIPVIAIVMSVMFLKTGTFDMALEKDTNFGFLLSNFYIANSINIWGIAFLLVPVAFLFRRTYNDKYNYTFIAWFIVSLIFWSANTTNHEFRFAIQFMPAVYYLAILAIENIAKTKITLDSITSRFRSPTKNTGGKESAYT